ncbi:MAG TPA: NRDE family protein, partial [Acidimicrobiales bacterium]|nr:NRDE family protein [Acidimicrobiales bacterium]
MCLLVVVFGVDPGAPLVVGANRDERLARPATAMGVLRPDPPRILGGRDFEAGGTWLAVNRHGLVAGLTNRPVPDGRDPTKRTRGELPLALVRHLSADRAVEAFVEAVRPSDYNPAWLLVGDRVSLFAIDMTAGARPVVSELGPGVHVLENNPLGAPSAKV